MNQQENDATPEPQVSVPSVITPEESAPEVNISEAEDQPEARSGDETKPAIPTAIVPESMGTPAAAASKPSTPEVVGRPRPVSPRVFAPKPVAAPKDGRPKTLPPKSVAPSIDEITKAFAAETVGKGIKPKEPMIMRCAFRYFEKSGARDYRLVREKRTMTMDLILKKLRVTVRDAYRERMPEDDAMRRARAFGTACTRAKKVLVDSTLDTDEVLLAAGLFHKANGELDRQLPPKHLFGRLLRSAQSKVANGRRKKPKVEARTVSLDGLIKDMETMLDIDSDGLWDRLIPWLESHNFRIEDMEAAPLEE